MPLFHLAFPVQDLQSTRRFYVDVLNCGVGRESENWIDFDFYAHQITAHRVETMPAVPTNEVDGCAVPVSHFGLILEWSQWQELAERLQAADDVRFLIEPRVRFEGQPGEQATLFIVDPSGNGLEFKAFRNREAVFAKD